MREGQYGDDNNQYGNQCDDRASNAAALSVSPDMIYSARFQETVQTDGSTYTVHIYHPRDIEAPVVDDPPPPDDDPPPGCIDINSASHEGLQEIIHIGPVRADDIIAGRPWFSIDELDQVSGIGPSRLQDIKHQGLACV